MSRAENFDPYSQWLGIDTRAGVISYYSLLGLPPFEADAGRISQAADERMKLIRQYQVGPRGKFTQPVLNELASARICLLSATHKAAYDAALRTALAPPPAVPPAAKPPVPKRKLADIMPPTWEGTVAAPPIAPQAVSPPRFFLTEEATARTGIDFARHRSQRPLLAFAALGAMLLLVVVLGVVLWQRISQPPLQEVDLSGPKIAPQIEEPPPDKHQPEPPPKSVVVLQEGSGELNLTPATALVEGKLVREVLGTGDALVGWSSKDEIAEWQFKLVKPGFFELELQYVSHPSLAGKIVSIAWDKDLKRVALRPPDQEETVRDSQIILIKRGGEHSLTMQPAEPLPAGALKLISIRLIPATGP